MKENKIIEWILTAVFLILSVIGIIFLIWSLIGDSPSAFQILSTLVGIIVSYLFVMSYKIGIFMGEMREFKETAIRSFDRTREDINKLNEKVSNVEKSVSEMKSDLRTIAEKVK